MVPNGITHQVVTDDTEGVGAILDWLLLGQGLECLISSFQSETRCGFAKSAKC